MQSLNRGAAPLLFFALLGGLFGCTAKGEQKPRQIERVILISIDTLRADFLGAYNAKMKSSPNLDRFASESILFNNVTAQAPSTAISHKSLFYSLYPAIHKTTKDSIPVEDLKSPLEVLKARGFKTAAFVGGGQLNRKFGFAKGFDSYWEAAGKREGEKDRFNLETIFKNSVDWLRKNRAEKFFLFFHTYEVHCPYFPPEQYVNKYAAWYDGDVNPRGKCGDNYYNQRSLSAEDYKYIRDLYAGSVDYVDDVMGRLFAELKSLNIYDDTLIIFLSDHGESLGERDYVGHNQLYNVQLRVPLMMHIPNLRSAHVEAPVEVIDVIPTLFKLLNVPAPYPFQGRNLLPLISGKQTFEPDRLLISEQKERIRVQAGTMAAIFSSDQSNPDELYDLSHDPEERNNLAVNQRDVVRKLKTAYAKMLDKNRSLSAHFLVGTKPELDRELQEQLKALGYIQ